MWAALLPLAFRSRPSGSELPSYLFSLSVRGVVIRWLLMLNKNTTENVVLVRCWLRLLVLLLFIVVYAIACWCFVVVSEVLLTSRSSGIS